MPAYQLYLHAMGMVLEAPQTRTVHTRQIAEFTLTVNPQRNGTRSTRTPADTILHVTAWSDYLTRRVMDEIRPGQNIALHGDLKIEPSLGTDLAPRVTYDLYMADDYHILSTHDHPTSAEHHQLYLHASGNVVDEPETRALDGRTHAIVKVAVNKRRRPADGQRNAGDTTYLRLTAWGEPFAARVAEQLHKGQNISLHGTLRIEPFVGTDKIPRVVNSVTLDDYRIHTPRSNPTFNHDQDHDQPDELPALPPAPPPATSQPQRAYPQPIPTYQPPSPAPQHAAQPASLSPLSFSRPGPTPTPAPVSAPTTESDDDDDGFYI